MNGLENVVEYIRADTSDICSKIAQKSSEECDRIKADYLKREQSEYWEAINTGTKGAEIRLESLSNLANAEANKQITAMQNEMLTQAFSVAAMKLNELSDENYDLLLKKLGAPSGTDSNELVAQFKERLTNEVLNTLFN